MPSQDDYLDELLKGISDEADGAAGDEGNAVSVDSPDLDAVAGMTEEEIAKLLAAGSDEPAVAEEPVQSRTQGNGDSLEDVIAMLEGTADSDLQEIQDLLQKSDNNELVDTNQDLEDNISPVDKLLSDIEGAEGEGDALDAKGQRALEKKRRKEEKLAQKKAKKEEKKAAKAKKSRKEKAKTGKRQSEEDPSIEYDVLDSIVSDAGKIGQKDTAADAIVEIDKEEADSLIPDIAVLEGEEETKEEPKEKNSLFARFVAFLMEEDEEDEKTENENLRLSKENQDIINELDKENAKKGDKSKKKKKEKPKKEPKPKKAPKPKKEKPPKEEEPEPSGSRLTLKKVLPIVLLGASVGAVILIFVNISMDFADKKVARNAYQEGDYEACFQNLYGKKLNDEEALMYGKSESILYISLWYRKYEVFAGEGKEVQALDILIQAVNDYPMLYEYASQWNAIAEISEVYSSMVNILRDKYGITEAQALEIAAEKSDLEYTKMVTGIANGMTYDSLRNPGSVQQPVEQELPNELPEESDIGQGNFVDNQR